MAKHDPTRRYRQVQVETAAKDDLLILLVEGGVRFAEGGALELEKGEEEDRARRNDQLVRAQQILLELIGALSPAIGLELYEKLQGLYHFTFTRLFEGNVESDLTKVREGIEIFCQIRDMWKDAVEKAKTEERRPPQKPLPNSTISVKG